MEEQPDDQYEESEKEEPEPKEEKPLVCKPVKTDLKEKVQCACGRWMSQHTYKYQHKCKAQTVNEAAAAPVEEAPPVKAPKPKRVVLEKAPPPEKPIKQKAVIKKQARLAHPLAPPVDIYQAMLFNRQEQARRHREAMLAPYQQMFSMRR